MFESLKVWRNGEIIAWNEATVHLLSHGFSRASAIFDVFGVHPTPEGVMAFRMDKHLERLYRSAELLGMEMGFSKEEIVSGVSRVIKENKIKRGLVKILAYYSEEALINLVLDSRLDVAIFGVGEFDGLGLDNYTPITACFSRWRKIHPATVPVEAKACSNYLNGMLARREARQRGYDIGILVTTDGYVAEGSIESVFMVKDGTLHVPKLGNVLRSITRMSIIEAAEHLGIAVFERDITPAEFMQADEIFASHTGTKVQPVRKMEDRILKPVPGPVTLKLMEFMEDICKLKVKAFRSWMQPV